MKRVINFWLFGCVITLIGASCTNGVKPTVVAVDSTLVTTEMAGTTSEKNGPNLFDKWFEEFQEVNPHWTQTTEGHQKLTDAFKEKMTSDLEFAKSVCKCDVFTSECITSYERKDGEYGGIWSFVFKKTVTLKNPLYNGQKEVDLAYEIFSTIPATASHDRPYLENVNYSDTFNPYHDINYSGTLNLGSFIVTKKE